MADTVRILKALSDENRFRIFNRLLEGETCACELLEMLDIAQPTLSRHMRVLLDSGIVKGRKDAQWMRYSVDTTVLKEIKDYFQSLEPKYIVKIE